LIGPQETPFPSRLDKNSYQLGLTSRQDYSVTCLPPSTLQAPRIRPVETSHMNLWSELDEMTTVELLNNEPLILGQHIGMGDHILTSTQELPPTDFLLAAEPNSVKLTGPLPQILPSPKTHGVDAHSVDKDEYLSSQDSTKKATNQISNFLLSRDSKSKMLKWECGSDTSSNTKPCTVGSARGIPKKKKGLGRRGCLSPEGAENAKRMRRCRACLSCWILKVTVSFLF